MIPAPADVAPPPLLRIGLIVLAAGSSTRMGRPKQLLPIDGRPLIAHVVQAALASPARPVAVVLGAHAEAVRTALEGLPAIIVDNPNWEEGMAASIRTGLAALLATENPASQLDGILIALGDQPGFSAATIDALIAAFQPPVHTIAAAFFNGQLAAPALFGRIHFDELARLAGASGARSLFVRHANQVAPVELPALAVDLDTPDDYAAWLAKASP